MRLKISTERTNAPMKLFRLEVEYRLVAVFLGLVALQYVIPNPALASGWNVSIDNTANRKSSAQLEGNQSRAPAGSEDNPYLICANSSITISWSAQVTGTVPSKHSECDVSGPTWEWSGEASGQKSTISIKRSALSPGIHKFTETATATYTYSPVSFAPPNHKCPQPASNSSSNTVYVSVSNHTSTWEEYHAAQLTWPPAQSKSYDVNRYSLSAGGDWEIEEHEVGKIVTDEIYYEENWISLDCGQHVTSSMSTEYKWTTAANVNINLYDIVTMGTGLSANVSSQQVKSYSFGGTNGVMFRWKLKEPGWRYIDMRGNWEYRMSQVVGIWGQWQPDGVESNKSVPIKDYKLDSGGSDFEKQWKCCG